MAGMAFAFSRELSRAVRPRSVVELEGDGVKPSTLRGPRWRSTSRGFFVPADVPLSTTQRVLEAVPLVPAAGALSGWAAAYVLGVDFLDGLHHETLMPFPVTVSLGSSAGRADTSQIHYVRDRLPFDHCLVRHRIRVTNPARTAFDGARWAPNLVDAVVFLDQVGHALDLDVTCLGVWCEPGGWWRGVDQVREALTWADMRSASPWETRLRLFYQQQAGLPRPQVNVPIFDLHERLLGIADLLDEEAGLVTEFDGREHRDRRQHQSDNIREEKLEGTNLTVCRVDSLDMRQPVPLTERLQARRAQGMRRNRSLDAWTLAQPTWWLRHRAS